LSAQRYGECEALVFESRRWSYSELNTDVHALAAGLRKLGIERTDRVAVIAMNSAEFLILALALARLGAVLVPLNYRLQEQDLVELIERSGAIGLASEAEFDQIANAVKDAMAKLRMLLALTGDLPEPFVSIPGLISEYRGCRVDDVVCDANTLQRIMYTSGTTSQPKGARITHGNCRANMTSLAEEFRINQQDRVMILAPLYHVGGFDIPGLTVFYVGGTVVLLRRFDAERALATIVRERITGTTLVATMMNMILALPECTLVDTRSLRWIIFGQVTRELFDRALQVFPTAALTEGYGMTEACGGVAYVDRLHLREKLGSVGLAIEGMEIRLVDESGQPVLEGTSGEIALRGAKVFAGYVDDPEATDKALRNGWLHTGDVGHFDADGYLYVTDRIKDMIRSGGENISASEIENVVLAADGIEDAAVIGIPDPYWVEVPAVFVVSRSGQAIKVDALLTHCRTRLAGFKRPKAVFQVEALPRNVTGKILKDELRILATKLIPAWVAESGVDGFTG